jgi:hypothetical protein
MFWSSSPTTIKESLTALNRRRDNGLLLGILKIGQDNSVVEYCLFVVVKLCLLGWHWA